MKKNILSILVLLALANIAYFNSFNNSFHFDDFISISENKNLKDLDYLWELYSSFFSIFQNRALVQTSLLLNYHFSRLNVFGYHLFNNCVHSLVVVMVFFVSKCLAAISACSQRRGNGFPQKKSNQVIYFPFLAALFFGIHPIFTESIVYISSRSSTLLTLFFLLSVYFFIRFQKSGGRIIHFLFFLLFCALGMAAKKNFAVLPVVALLYGFSFHSEWVKEKIKKHKALIGIFAATVFIFIFYISASKERTAAFFHAVIGPEDRQWSPHQYFLTELNVIVFYYLKKFLFPFELSIDPFFKVSNSFFSLSCLSIIVLLTIIFFMQRARKTDPILCFGGLWTLGTIAPTSSFLPLLDFVSEHRLYLPGFGLVLVFCRMIYKFKSPPLYAICFFLVFLSGLTMERNFIWKNSMGLWSDAIRKSPGNPRPYYNLAKFYQDSGKFDEAANEYKKAIGIVPKGVFPYIGLGGLYLQMGNLPLAEEHLKKALKVKPDEPEATTKLAQVHFKTGNYELAEELLTREYIKDEQIGACYLLGQIYSIKNKNGAALRQFQRAIKLNPDFAEAYVGMGIIYGKEKKFDLAEKYFLKSVEVKKENPDAYLNIGYLHFMQKRYDEALSLYRKALEYDPKMERAWIYSGDAFFMLKNYEEAIRWYDFVKAEGEMRNEALYKAGSCYLEIGDPEKADVFFTRLKLDRKEDAGLFLQIGAKLDEKGQRSLAFKYYEKAAGLDPENIKINYLDGK